LRSLSVSSMVQFARCQKQFYWTVVRPLPRRPSAAARLGQEIHRWIEIKSIGQGRLDDPEHVPDLSPDELRDDHGPGGPPRSLEALKASFAASPYAAMSPRHVEQPFVIALEGGFLLRGRMDAVYVHPDGTWEVVDFKTGARPEPEDSTSRMQLAIYALAAQRIWCVPADRLRVTYLYLRDGAAVSTPATELGVSEDDLVAQFRRIAAGGFEPVPGAVCRACDFLRFCAAGRAHVEAETSAPSVAR
jgi:DNA helicase II / ATP-dependent DNA helicase PcrA